ncbi:unnamed protein product [Malassezia sympodialis ATCC 42132]|uniref:uncharacterized protein n=1 Tax=Malassezia sympodialis (strain ATCC 42132) TaxID=1230383 RepID=UPI0002C29A3E|nr:uncharacterized protein MSY001_0918 [Malassezia sympodialis ATCC 42132]CCU98212.1 unnamed protein product [Malassezia sympodialis ATCC 42132]|eukprot:XP_018739531.1 uncharacterized protein MSY001_0918 [Malassezia sympodialis ATCC 42132]
MVRGACLQQIVRVRSKDGQLRFQVEASDDAAVLVAQIAEALHTDPSRLTLSDAPGSGGRAASELAGHTLEALGIKYAAAAPAATSDAPPTAAPGASVQEHPIDVYWSRERGLIARARDAQFCRHGEKGMCDYCMPLEPYDVAYHTEHGIKHLSFHAYLRQQNIGVDTSASTSAYVPPLDEETYRVLTPCPSGQHAPWPAGICTKCQPSAITLQRQPYRMVDHVEFAHPALIEGLLDIWRKTATQRCGFLLGHYEPYPDVPMGIKAVVEAITEPPQAGDLDGLTLGWPWDEEALVQRVAGWCGLEIVGFLFTDLEPADPTHTNASQAGLVACKRHATSFFLSGQEALMAAQWQSMHKNACRWSRTGAFNSKFVTCVLSGNPEGVIDVAAYQVSGQAMGMVEADMLEASVHPTTVRVKPSADTRYVPDVFFRYKNEYKIDVKESAAPTFPVEYLLVTCTHGFPTDPNPRFLSHAFPIENRPGLHDQSLDAVLAQVRAWPHAVTDASAREALARWLSDWHLLLFLAKSELFSPEDMQGLCAAATTHDARDALERVLASPGWQTLVTMAQMQAPPTPSEAPAPSDEASPEASAASSIACPHCTFLNAPGSTDCDVCGLPLS